MVVVCRVDMGLGVSEWEFYRFKVAGPRVIGILNSLFK